MRMEKRWRLRRIEAWGGRERFGIAGIIASG